MSTNLLNWNYAGVKIEIKNAEGTMISAITIPSGGNISIKVPTRQELIRLKFNNSIGVPITVTDAADKYNVHRNTILFWIKSGYITVIQSGYRSIIDEADIAYCAEIHHQRKQVGSLSGAPLFDKNGLPYELKHPELSKKRKQKPLAD